MDLRGFAGTPERVTSPAPVNEALADKVPLVPTVAPYRPLDLSALGLRYTGFRQTVVLPYKVLPFTVPNLHRQKIRIRSGRWVVSYWFCYCAALVTYVIILPVWSSSPDVASIAPDDMGGDNSIGYFGKNPTGYHWGFTTTFLAFQQMIPFGFLLPEGEIFLGAHYVNYFGESVITQQVFCLDEVVKL